MKIDCMRLFAMLWVLLALAPVRAEVRTQAVVYRDGDVELQGYLVWDDAIQGKRPGVIVVHEWWGLNDYARKRAEMLAEHGYVGFAIDMYGKGRVTEHAQKAGDWAKQIQANVGRWQRRALVGLKALREQETVDAERIAAIGYCFGGATVMQMAYSGADLDGVVSFHGSLPIPSEEQGKEIRSKILVAHGSRDSFVPSERVLEFQAALDRARADWEMDIYAGARHGFTNPDAGKYGIDNVRYDADADRRSWDRMLRFFDEIFPGADAGNGG
jgi:dienelactone hydrolase